MKKYLFSDLDGTLMLNKDLSIPGLIVPSHNLEAIKEWTKCGHEFGIATGRPHFSVEQLNKSNDLSGICICENGMIIYEHDKEIFADKINHAELKMTLEYAVENKIEFIGFYRHSNQCFINFQVQGKATLKRLKKYEGIFDFSHYNATNLDNIVHLTLLFENQTQKEQIIKQLNHLLKKSKVVSTTHDGADFVNKTTNKLHAILKYAKIKDIDETQIGYVGDGLNDVECLNYFANSFVMENATEELLKELTNKNIKYVKDVKSAIKLFKEG